MMVETHVYVTQIKWQDGCDDEDDHDHPEEFEAVVDIPIDCMSDPVAMDSEIHMALIEQCDCCVEECDIEVLGETVRNFVL